MTDPGEAPQAIRAWLTIPRNIEKAIEGLTDEALELQGGPDDWSIRETVHHLAEAILIASNIMIAGLAKSGSIYDWSWVNPDASWMQRMGYKTVPVRTALATLHALCEHMAALIMTTSDGIMREVELLDAPGAKPYTKTFKDLLMQEVEHAEEHIRTIGQTRATHTGAESTEDS